MNEQILELDQVIVDNDLNPRQGALDQDVVLDYSAHVDDLPAMTAYDVQGFYFLVGGFHRYAAHRLAQRSTGRFVVHQGSREEAKEYADLDNLKHGLRLSRSERREVIRRQLKRHPEWSDNRLSSACYTTDKTVRVIREELEATSEIPKLDILTGADGIARPRAMTRQAVEPVADGRQTTFESSAPAVMEAQSPVIPPAMLRPVEELEIVSEPTDAPAPWEMTPAQAAAGLARLEADLKAVPVPTEDDDAHEDLPDETGEEQGDNDDIPTVEAAQPPSPVVPPPPPAPAPPSPPPPPPSPTVSEAPWQITLTVRGETPPLLMVMRGGAMERYLPEAVARRVIAAVEAVIEPAAVETPGEWLEVN